MLEESEKIEEKLKKKAKIDISTLVFFPIIYLATFNAYTKFEDCGSDRAEKSLTENLIGEKEKLTNKMND